MSGLSGASGAQPSDHSTPIISAVSRGGLTWQKAVAGTAAALATAWAASTSYTAGDVVKNKGRFFRCITSGTSAVSGGPDSVSADITDGTAHWSGGATGFDNGLFIVNMASAGGQAVYWGFAGVTSSTGLPIYAGGGLSISIADPTLIWVITATSTSTVGVAGLS